MSNMRKRLAHWLMRVGSLLGRARSEDVTAERAFVIAPHPDDEVFGCGGTIVKKIRRGAQVRVAILTDGRTSHSAFIDQGELIQIRREEAANAAVALGLSIADYRFLDFPDGELARYRESAVQAVLAQLQEFKPAEVYVPHAEDVQPDHEAAYSIAMEALKRQRATATVYEFPVWLWHTWPWTWGSGPGVGQGRLSYLLAAARRVFLLAIACPLRVDITEVRATKLAAVKAYRSQIERRHGFPNWPVMADVAGGELLERLTSAEERFRMTRYAA
jgi:LmbE family N-acetylglucosaminyl deacetylase